VQFNHLSAAMLYCDGPQTRNNVCASFVLFVKYCDNKSNEIRPLMKFGCFVLSSLRMCIVSTMLSVRKMSKRSCHIISVRCRLKKNNCGRLQSYCYKRHKMTTHDFLFSVIVHCNKMRTNGVKPLPAAKMTKCSIDFAVNRACEQNVPALSDTFIVSPENRMIINRNCTYQFVIVQATTTFFHLA
jgi:hypothetical protein